MSQLGLALGVVLTAGGALVASAAAGTPPVQARELRVCADPNNLPFSNEKGEGFENKIAERLARELKATLRYTWRPQRRGFVRNTLNTGECDVVMGVPSNYDLVRTTKPYYRSTYVFVYRQDRGFKVASLADTVLSRLTIGIHLIDGEANPPPAYSLAARGLIDNVKGYSIYGDYSQPNPPARLIEAVVKGDVDVAIVWGPLAGFFAKRLGAPLAIVPVPPESDPVGQQWSFPIAMGVRRRDTALAAELDRVLSADRAGIRNILESNGVPIVPEPATPKSPDTKRP